MKCKGSMALLADRDPEEPRIHEVTSHAREAREMDIRFWQEQADTESRKGESP
jgi:hypothetical protein